MKDNTSAYQQVRSEGDLGTGRWRRSGWRELLVEEDVGRVRVEPVLHVDERLERGERDFAVVEDVPTALLVVTLPDVVEIFKLEMNNHGHKEPWKIIRNVA